MARCVCCDAILPSNTVYRTILVPHPEDPKLKVNMRVEEDMCSKCVSRSKYNFVEEETIPLEDLGLSSLDYKYLYE